MIEDFFLIDGFNLFDGVGGFFDAFDSRSFEADAGRADSAGDSEIEFDRSFDLSGTGILLPAVVGRLFSAGLDFLSPRAEAEPMAVIRRGPISLEFDSTDSAGDVGDDNFLAPNEAESKSTLTDRPLTRVDFLTRGSE